MADLMETMIETQVKEASTPRESASSKPVAFSDAFRLGWRDTPRLGADGRIGYERVSLTSYDILHPKLGDHRSHSKEHKETCVYLNDVLSAQTAHDPHAVVLHDTGVQWDDPELLWHSPDVALIFGVRQMKNWGMFKVVEEGVRPRLIIEITSPDTRNLDLIDKADAYERAGVEFYVIVDAYISKRHPAYELIGNELTPDGYVELAPDERGRLWLEPAQIWIGLEGNRVVCYDVEGNRFERYPSVVEARAEAETRAEQAETRAEQAETRAAAEAAQRLALEERLRALEAEMRHLTGESA